MESSIMPEKLFRPFAFPPRINILFDDMPAFFATGRTSGRRRALTNNRVALDSSRACFSSKGVEYDDIKAKGVVIARRECNMVI
jgi:hypothetical protein